MYLIEPNRTPRRGSGRLLGCVCEHSVAGVNGLLSPVMAPFSERVEQGFIPRSYCPSGHQLLQDEGVRGGELLRCLVGCEHGQGALPIGQWTS